MRHCRLETGRQDLPKLIPTRFRSKGRVAAGSITGPSILYDASTATAQIIEPDQPAYDKEIPDMKVLSYILYVYATIRGLWDRSDNTVIGPAINAYAAMLLIWERFEKYSFKCILLYFIDHFETRQQSTDPKGMDDCRPTSAFSAYAPPTRADHMQSTSLCPVLFYDTPSKPPAG